MTNAPTTALTLLPDDRADHLAAELARLRPVLKACALALTRSDTAADDLVQDTLTRALEHRRLFRSGSSLKAWAVSILRNLLVDQWRRKSLVLGCDLDRAAAAEQPRSSPSYLDVIDIADVRRAMAILTPRQREIFELAYFLALPHRAIAARFQVELATVGTSLFRSKAKLRVELERLVAERVLPE